jgi:hypothetical protein
MPQGHVAQHQTMASAENKMCGPRAMSTSSQRRVHLAREHPPAVQHRSAKSEGDTASESLRSSARSLVVVMHENVVAALCRGIVSTTPFSTLAHSPSTARHDDDALAQSVAT